MQEPSQLERFLSDQSQQGSLDSEGQFSLTQGKALAKLAEFQLPYNGAWGVKVVQAAVAAGETGSIKVTISRATAEFVFACPLSWTASGVEAAILDVNPSSEPALNHLVAALRAVGLNEERGFMVQLPGDESNLIWDGERLLQVPRIVTQEYLVLTVANSARGGGHGFLNRAAPRRSADLTRALSVYCFTCPVPLRLDGRRLDALELCETHGIGSNSQPVYAGFRTGDLPIIPIPSGTGERILNSGQTLHVNLSEVSEASLTAVRRAAERGVRPSVVYLLAVHVMPADSGGWELGTGQSKCYWVQDGAVVGTETHHEDAGVCSVAYFVNAQGLGNDLTTLRLLQSEEREKRQELALELVRSGLHEATELPLHKMSEFARSSGKVVAAAGAVLGLGIAVIAPPAGLITLACSALYASGAGQREKRFVEEQLRPAVNDLLARF